MRVANQIVVDYHDHTIRIDGEVFPYYVTNRPEPAVTLGEDGKTSILTISIPAYDIEVRR